MYKKNFAIDFFFKFLQCVLIFSEKRNETDVFYMTRVSRETNDFLGFFIDFIDLLDFGRTVQVGPPNPEETPAQFHSST